MRPPTLSVRIPLDVRRALEARADADGRTLHGEVVEILTAAVRDELGPEPGRTGPGSPSTLGALFARDADTRA